MKSNFTIRVEEQRDFKTVENLTRESFWNVYRPGCTEHYVLHCFRDNPDFIPALSLVMEKDGKPTGEKFPIATFGPISIHPDFKRQGYGLALLNYALEKAKTLGIGFICMEGNIQFYSHAGFDLASKLKIHYHAEPKDSEVPYFLAQELIPGYLNGIEATYTPPKGYFIAEENPDEFAKYEAQFPYKEKLVLPGQLG